MTKTERATAKAAKYKNERLAHRAANNQVSPVGVILGDDGRFWVAETFRDFQLLLKAGYEALHYHDVR